MSLTMRALEIYCVRFTALVKSVEAHMHMRITPPPHPFRIKFRDIKLCGMAYPAMRLLRQ